MEDQLRATGEGTFSYIRQPELLSQVPFSAATLWRKVKDGTFVKPVKLSERITAWNRAEVLQWLRDREGAL